MDSLRKPFQGVSNIILFNWHFYLIAFALFILGSLMFLYVHSFLQILVVLSLSLAFLSIIISLLVSYYIYDLSGLYELSWLEIDHKEYSFVNIHAGFDETSQLLESKLGKGIVIFDFFDSEIHTEVSIKRARKKYPNDSRTIKIQSHTIPLESNSVDKIFVLLSAHEIRNEEERIVFFKELKRVINQSGKVYIMEHLRDVPNFVAFNIGFFHFYSRKTWKETFELSGFVLEEEIKCTPFISMFKLS